jgi:hypothetical protein
MKKTLIIALLAGLGFGALAETQYKVYDLTIGLKAAKAGGVTSTSCGDDYIYRVKGSRKLQGVIAGCGCLAMAGDETCENFQLYLWDATTKTQLTNFTFTTGILQRIAKKGDSVEHFLTIEVADPDGEKFVLQLAGFGTYKASKVDAKYDTMLVSGGVTGTVDAPYKTILGSCTACAVTPDVTEQTQAVAICEEGVCTASDTSDVSPVYGSYTMKYNASKSKKAEKSGVTAKTLGLPTYVRLAD